MENKHENLRKAMVDLLKKDLIGPYHGESEIIESGPDETPFKRYLCGILFPKDSHYSREDDDGGIGLDSDTLYEDSEESLSLSNSRHPSCFGISFACPESVESIEINVSAGIYNLEEKNEGIEKSIKWKRTPLNWNNPINIQESKEVQEEIFPKLLLRLKIRPPDKNSIKAITLSLININEEDSKIPQIRCERSFFQVYFCVKGISGERPFVERKHCYKSDISLEEQCVHLLYSNSRSYAAGHGCSATWENEKDGKVQEIKSSFIPEQPVYPLVVPRDIGLPDFSIKMISEASVDQLNNVFMSIPDRYDEWIDKREKEIAGIPKEFHNAAIHHINLCKESSQRIKKGIKKIKEVSDVREAFQLAHKAMLYHFAHSAWLRKKTGESIDQGPAYDESHKWRPFQIAFILQCLESIAEPDSEDRDIVDLLWFPTGGGKTEAYLGLTAFVLFLRRIKALKKGERGEGTAVITRYTLRLLTIDQFYRTALLACSCEKVRNENQGKLKTSAPISIGLWVGGEASPNRLKDARRVLNKMKLGKERVDEVDPVKLRECPWCGTSLGPADYDIVDSRMKIKCRNINCEYHNFIPVWIVDDDLYNEKPSILIGTVDKFARLPWVKEAGYFFGSDNKTNPPELVIQDELHLISGPLGTLVGLYETAIDFLCKKRNKYSPKVIASTATIRNAPIQIKGLFDRRVHQFPQPGLTYSDSFFAREDKNQPARLFAGVFAPGMSPTTSLVRTFACLLHSSGSTKTDVEIKDTYWTLMGYFNSLRELGGARRQVEDDVVDYLKFCSERDGLSESSSRIRTIENVQELTSRVSSSDLDEIRKSLWKKLPDEECLDVVLSTNMISVGLDIPRLGLMAIIGQPKTTSEYIQATSRIGRKYPGLVVTIYNWTRSRDRSHYEHFKTYHSRLYSEVEATSVTPFSSRARDRALHAVFITLVRHLVSNLSENDSAVLFNKEDDLVKEINKHIIQRVKNVDILEFEETSDEINEIINRWIRLCAPGELYFYSNKHPSLMIPAEKKDEYSQSFATLNSLRNVDHSVGLYLEKL